MSLSQKEIEVLIEKLRGKYLESAKKFSPRWFDINAFNDRLSMAVRNRMNLEGFILAEITNFEKIRTQYDKKKRKNDFTRKVDRIIEENIARIRKYPELPFHPRAGLELPLFIGAGVELSRHLYPIIPYIIRKGPYRGKALTIEEQLTYLFVPTGKRNPKRVEDHILLLERQGVTDLEIEKDRNSFLKEGAFVFFTIIDFVDELLQEKNAEWELPLLFDKLYLQGEQRKKILENFARHTGYGSMIRVRDYAESILVDFRLTAFRPR